MEEKSSNNRFRLIAVLALMVAICAFAAVTYRHHLTCDDSYISYTYARNLAEGRGLTWTTGERVEGYTNFLLTLILAGGHAVGIAPETMSPIIGVLSGLFLIIVIWLAVFRQCRGNWSFLLLAPILLGLNRSFGAWSASGLETTLFTLLALSGVFRYLDEREKKSTIPWQSALLLSLSALTRPEGMLFFGLVGVFFFVDLATRKRGIKELGIWAGVFLIIVGSHVIWRYAYYGYLLPNTFYAKTRGELLDLGIGYLEKLNQAYRLELLGIPALCGILLRFSHRQALFAAIFLSYLAYAATVGGDFLEFRFVLPVLPYFYLLFAAGIQAIWEKRNRTTEEGTQRRLPIVIVSVIFIAFSLIVNFQGSFSNRPVIVRSGGLISLKRIRTFAEMRIMMGEYLKEKIDQEVLPADLRVEAGGVGILPYYTRWYTIDRFGLNDTYLARTAPLTKNDRSGHIQGFDLAYTQSKNVAMVMMSAMSPLFLVNSKFDEKKRIREVQEKIEERNLETDNRKYQLRLKAYRMDKNHILVFGTNMPESELAPLFSKLDQIE